MRGLRRAASIASLAVAISAVAWWTVPPSSTVERGWLETVMDLGRRSSLLIVLLLTLGLSACRGCRPTPPAGSGPGPGEGAAGSVDLQIEFYGGFAYVPTLAENRLEIAYLESTNVADCSVKQLGTDLQVIEGRIVEPSTPEASNRFNLDRAVVTFPALESGSIPLIVPRSQRPMTPPFKPANTSRAAEWEDLKWVPNVREELKSSLNPDWRNLVNGRLVLRGGRVKGLHPSDVVVRDSEFEFRRKDGTPAFRQAITDRCSTTCASLPGRSSSVERRDVEDDADRRRTGESWQAGDPQGDRQAHRAHRRSAAGWVRNQGLLRLLSVAAADTAQHRLAAADLPWKFRADRHRQRAAIAWPVLPWRFFLSGVSAMNRLFVPRRLSA